MTSGEDSIGQENNKLAVSFSADLHVSAMTMR
jgi:hypothetical protein